MRQVAATLQPGHAMEVNFVIKKFMELPDVERRRIYDALKSEDEETSVRASFDILKLLTHADSAELTQYANSALKLDLTGYFVWDEVENLISRAIWLNHYFSANLKLDGEQRVRIDSIPVAAESTIGQTSSVSTPPFKKFYEPEVQVSEVEQAKEELNAFMQTDDWRGFLRRLAGYEGIRVHKYDDACSHHEGVWLTATGFVDAYKRPIKDLTEVIEGFLFEHMHDSPPAHPSQFIPWLKFSWEYRAWKSGQ